MAVLLLCYYRYTKAAGAAADAQRALNNDLLWLFSALDAITPSVYLGIKEAEVCLGFGAL